MKNKTIITAALNGSQGSKEKNPHTPITPDEIINDAYQCFLKGAAIVHIHLKAEDGLLPTINNETFNYIKAGIQRKCNVIINFSTSGELNQFNGLELIGTPDVKQEKRLNILETQPEIATFDVPTMNFSERIFMNPINFLRQLGQRSQALGILPEVEVYTMADIAQAERFIATGDLPAKPLFQICLGIIGGTPATVKHLLFLKESLPPQAIWSAFGLGVNHLPMMYATLAMGGHIRVGLEDNLYYAKGQLTSNVELVQRASRIITEFGQQVATPDEARHILGI